MILEYNNRYKLKYSFKLYLNPVNKLRELIASLIIYIVLFKKHVLL